MPERTRNALLTCPGVPLALLGAFAIGLLLALGVPTLANGVPLQQEPAAEPQRGEEPQASQPIPDPPSFRYGTIMNIEEIGGDLFVWAQSVNVTGEVLHNAFLAGQMVSLAGGTVDGDLFAFGASTTVDGEVMGDVYSFSNETRITHDAMIHGNVLVFSGSVRIEGTVRGKVQGSGGLVIITGEVGSLDLEVGSLSLSPDARVHGELKYESGDEASIDDDATIDGEIIWNQESDEPDEQDEEEDADGWSFWNIMWTLWKYLANLVVGFAFLLLGGVGARLPAACLRSHPAPGLGFGFVVAVVFPISCLVAIVLIVSAPLGLIGLTIFVLTAFLARLVTAQFVGDWLLRRAGKEQPSEYLSLALGFLLLMILAWIPYAGFLTRLAAIILGMGGIYLALRERGFPWVGDSEPVVPAMPTA